MKSVQIKWLQRGAGNRSGVTWGVPWKQGEQRADAEFVVTGKNGAVHPVQTWPLAYWPDGSLKWSAHAAVLPAGEDELFLRAGHAEPAQAVRVARLENGSVEIDTGRLLCRLAAGGQKAVDFIACGGKTVCSGAVPEAVLEHRADTPYGRRTETVRCPGQIDSLRILQEGPVRCCAELRGKHRLEGEDRTLLPFTLRFFFYAGEDRIRIQHTFLYDGDPQSDFVKGIGLAFQVPMDGELFNRRVALCGDSGFFYEPVQLLQSWRPKITRELYRAQLEGKNIGPDFPEFAVAAQAAKDIPAWNDYRLVQDSPNHYRVEKRTHPECCFVHALDGIRAGGLAFAGGAHGGLAAGIADFWEKAPRSLELSGMTESCAVLRAWLYSPDCEAMDLRHYDTRAYVQTYYEGAEELRSTPCGIGNTNELFLWAFSQTPDRVTLKDCAETVRCAPLPACTPKYYHETGAFGVWSLPDSGSERRAALEHQLDSLTTFYCEEVEQRGWYGFWNYGDVMHTYDGDRHCWKYDMGGYAWDNTELMSDLALWYQFLRTGSRKLFRMAAAMTRHVSEVDTYHTGPYRGLGSRHNVLHWGCGCKEARVSMAAHNRFLYYLTADERLGEIMDEAVNADFSTLELDPMRAYFPKDSFPTHARTGPDWSSFCSNWMTAWERFQDEACKKKIQTGIECLKHMPLHMISGPTFGYDPKDGTLHFLTESPGEHLMICQGEPEIWMELAGLLNDPQWNEMLAEYGRFYQLTPEEKVRQSGLEVKGQGWSFPLFAASMSAFAAKFYHDDKLAEKVWNIIECDTAAKFRAEPAPDGTYARPVSEIQNLSTNEAAQWCLNVIQCLELIGDRL